MSIKHHISRFVQLFRIEMTPRNLYFRLKYRNKFKELKGKYTGQRCFVIGNGPSLTAEDLELLKNEKTFGANRIFYMFNKTSWRPTFYCAQDLTVIKDCIDYFHDILNSVDLFFMIDSAAQFLPASVLHSDKTLLFFARRFAFHPQRVFSDAIDKYIDGGGTITYTSIQIAAYMGFSEIYLLGVDNNYSANSISNKTLKDKDVTDNYFKGMPNSIKINKPNLDQIAESYKAAKKYSEAHGISIINATRGGKLELFERRSLESIIGK